MNYEAINQQDEIIANLILETIEKGVPVWEKGWKCDEGFPIPHNPYTGTIYKGKNAAHLAIKSLFAGYSSVEFMTFNQIKDLNGYVRKGEKAYKVSFTYALNKLDDDELIALDETKRKKYENELAKLSPKQKEILNEDGQIFIIRAFSVFNIEQCTNIDMQKLNELKIKNKIPTKEEFEKLQFVENPFIEDILKNSGIEFKHEGSQAFYDPNNDIITLPPRENFKSVNEYYSTALHELGHATGHPSRLKRDLSGKFGTESYAKEELRAETYSFIQAFELKLDYNLPNHASYLDHWNKIAKGDKDEIKNAVKDAMKILNFVKSNWYPKEKSLNLDKNLNQNLERRQEKENQTKASQGYLFSR